ncbi:hypothetical protein bpr_I1393 [Butyrivibrio proteoclasticus B316]|uniref:Uncharacterized protein n=1 Tax=Butyrivibrio proteoclasticus (strain ATCC 51982 / DSM 14932 / B316) TaxID=515622 RepID=E0RUU0_BUTPB|nr:DUF6115 domain-containing protein [Butyrivibrio proteoclasticus]ADL34131.1 hypothetical protein bpr_I1393 [Butyrivibrio proteoclasticus B316]
MISITEVILIVAGFAAIILGYLLPAGKEMDEEDKMLMEREIRELVRREVEDQKETIENMVDDTVDNSLDRTERAMERISNEKLSAINEYSDTVINDIHKNHDEVMFMYDMLNDKHKNLTSVVSEVTKKTDEAKQAVKDAEATVRDAEATAREAKVATSNLNSITSKKENVRAILLDEDEDRLSGIRIPYNEKKDSITVHVKPEEPEPENSGYVSEENIQELKDIAAEVITKDQASGLHVIGNKGEQASAKVVPIAEARAANPDRNMMELTANDPISQNRRIIEMHKAGKSNMVIARELGLGIGEVKLVIDLSNKHRKVK